jgi:polyhydroxyalkanoate synthesis regulator phasin
MTTKNKSETKTSKKRLALPPTLVKNLEEVRKNLKTAQAKGKREVEKIVGRVAENDFVKKVCGHEVVQRATQVGNELTKEMEDRFKRLNRDWQETVKSVRTYFPFPTRSEVETLSRKVDRLSRKVDEISTRGRSLSAN